MEFELTSNNDFSATELANALRRSYWFVSNKGYSCANLDRLPLQFQGLKWREIYDFEHNVHYIRWKDIVIRERITHFPRSKSKVRIVDKIDDDSEPGLSFYPSSADEMKDGW